MKVMDVISFFLIIHFHSSYLLSGSELALFTFRAQVHVQIDSTIL